MNILTIGDVCGKPGMKILEKQLPLLRRETDAALTIVNGENAALSGISPNQAETLFYAGADVITLGNHTFARREIADTLDQDERLLRPANYAQALPGHGYGVFTALGREVLVISLIGRVGMDYGPDNPFTVIEGLLEQYGQRYKFIVLDMHAEATSEKKAMLYLLAGRVSIIIGTHTHVQTADERILSGTGYVTDIGMTGAYESVLGVDPKWSLEFFRNGKVLAYQSAPEGPIMINGAVFKLDDNTGRCLSVERIFRIFGQEGEKHELH